MPDGDLVRQGVGVTAAAVRCPSCGTEPTERARFCHECGSSLTEAAGAAEYKHVTVLFADVVRSMGLAAAVDIERLREIMTDLMERCAAVIRRFGGTVEYTGDGVMALFGAPVGLEDHAFRGCLAGLAIQEEARRLAADVQRRDRVDLRLRVGLNSGRVIVGRIGAGSLGYRATGEAVGLAQRMESVAPAGAVLLSEATAALVEHRAVLSEPEWVLIKGSEEPVRACRLIGIAGRQRRDGRGEAALVGRGPEMAALDAALEGAIGGCGGVVRVVGPPGIGKSRVAREAAALAAARGMDVVWVFCESHAQDVPFYAVTRLLQAGFGVVDLDAEVARAVVRAQLPGAEPDDLLLLDDLLGIGDPDCALSQINPDARRRRLTAMVNAASTARTEPALFVIEDAHWIDAASESMLVDFLAVIGRSPALVLATYRPEYRGALAAVPGAGVICLDPLGASDTATLIGELLGADPSVDELLAVVADRSGGNPFFAEEMVRELVQRGVLAGRPGHYLCSVDSAEVCVPSTVQAAIEARIDRLAPRAKRTLNAASVIGVRFGADLLPALAGDPEFDELIDAEFIDRVRLPPGEEYAFRHPLIRAVAYESQLKSDRAEWHRLLASMLEEHSPDAVEENAALIAEHLQAGGEHRAAYGWHMRAAAWSANRDVAAARRSWESARRIADGLPADSADWLAMRIAPRTLLSVTDFHAPAVQESRGRFAELRELCSAAGDKVSLAIGMTGLSSELLYGGRTAEAAELASEQMTLLESIGDPTLTMGTGFVAFACWYDAGQFGQLLKWSQTVIDLADGDAGKGAGFGFGSPLAAAMAFRGVARWWLGRTEWQGDLRDAVEMARNSDPATWAYILAWTYALEITHGVLPADDASIRLLDEAVEAARRTSDDNVVMLAEFNLGVALIFRDSSADRRRGLEVTRRTLGILRERVPSLVPPTEVWVAAEMADVDRDTALPMMRHAVDEILGTGRVGYSVCSAGAFAETLIRLGTEWDLAEAQEVIERLATMPVERDLAMVDITVLRLRALLARARGEDANFRDLVNRYLEMARSLGYEGHLRWAEVMAAEHG